MLSAVNSLAAASTGSSLTGTVLVVAVAADCPVTAPGDTGGGAVSRGPIGAGVVRTLPVVPGPGNTRCGPGVISTIGAVEVGTLTGVGAVVVMKFRFLDIFITLADKTYPS